MFSSFGFSQDELSGLNPRVWVSVRPGYSREELKELLLERGIAFTAEAVTTVDEMARRVLGISTRSFLRMAETRQEVLAAIVGLPTLQAQTPELLRVRAQPGFLKKLDRAIQTARLTASSEEERQVLHQRLGERLGEQALRQELEAVLAGYEAALSALQLWDPPRLLREARDRLQERFPGNPVGLIARWPERLVIYSAQEPESLEKSFLEELGRYCPVEWVRPEGALRLSTDSSLTWERWHTLDDAALSLVQVLRSEIHEKGNLTDLAVLIPDEPGVRRTVLRALEESGIPLEDPRDPTRVRVEESIKRGLLPLQLVAGDFERQTVLAWIRAYQSDHQDRGIWENDIAERGIRGRLESYQGRRLDSLSRTLVLLSEKLGRGRLSLAAVANWHLEVLRQDTRAQAWVLEFFSTAWKQFGADLELIGDSKPLRVRGWVTRFEERISSAKPPADRERTLGGLSLYRLSQAPLRKFRRVWALGIPDDWLTGEVGADYWFSERDRETLSPEFAVRSGRTVRAERLAVLREWLGAAASVTLLDGDYAPDGRERGSLEPFLMDLLGREQAGLVQRSSRGSQPRWLRAFSHLRAEMPRTAKLPPILPFADEAKPRISASDIEAYSRCPQQALFGRRWKLEDLREPGPALWADAQGNLLHAAVRRLVASRSEEGTFTSTPREALEASWEECVPRGLLRTRRAQEQERRRLVKILERFCEVESEYVRRSETRPLVLDDDLDLSWETSSAKIRGVPDRIDEHPGTDRGLFVIDYKSGTSLPYGTDMVDLGYRLQLPFYALAAARHFQRPVLGAQFVELASSGGRTKGIFFEEWNGKGAQKLHAFSSRTKSLLKRDPGEVWSRVEEWIDEVSLGFVEGIFGAHPRRSEECKDCRYADACGLGRRTSDSAGSAPGGTDE